LLAGVPAICLAIDSRTLELCQKMHIPHINCIDTEVDIPENNIDLLKQFFIKHFKFDIQKFEKHRELMKNYYIEAIRKNEI
jgi:hypothetical protein